jgi:hypothetical protein
LNCWFLIHTCIPVPPKKQHKKNCWFRPIYTTKISVSVLAEILATVDTHII